MKLFKFSAVSLLALFTLAGASWVDLTHNYNETTQHWPTTPKFVLTIQHQGFLAEDLWYASNSFCTSEHSGTHLDAPFHFNQNGWTIDQIPLENLVEVPAAVIDISERISQNAHPLDLTIEDIEAWEKVFGPIPVKGMVIMHSGWNKYWNDSNEYYNSTDLKNIETFSFPGIDPQAAQWLIDNRNIVGVGVDSASADGKGKPLSHKILLGSNVYILENLANVNHLPAKGAIVYAFPMKIEKGSGAPCRVMAKI